MYVATMGFLPELDVPAMVGMTGQMEQDIAMRKTHLIQALII